MSKGKFKADDFIFPSPPNMNITRATMASKTSIKVSKAFDASDFIFPSPPRLARRRSHGEQSIHATPILFGKNGNEFDPIDFDFATPPKRLFSRRGTAETPPGVAGGSKTFDPAEFVFPAAPNIAVDNTGTERTLPASQTAIPSKKFNPADFLFPTVPSKLMAEKTDAGWGSGTVAIASKRFDPTDFVFPVFPNSAVGTTGWAATAVIAQDPQLIPAEKISANIMGRIESNANVSPSPSGSCSLPVDESAVGLSLRLPTAHRRRSSPSALPSILTADVNRIGTPLPSAHGGPVTHPLIAAMEALPGTTAPYFIPER